MAPKHFPQDAFGDRFDLDKLPLPRQAAGYAVQMLDTDQLLDRISGEFMPVRDGELSPLHNSFDSAFEAAARWIDTHDQDISEHRLAIVPTGYDPALKRHVLIYGVLCAKP